MLFGTIAQQYPGAGEPIGEAGRPLVFLIFSYCFFYLFLQQLCFVFSESSPNMSFQSNSINGFPNHITSSVNVIWKTMTNAVFFGGGSKLFIYSGKFFQQEKVLWAD